MSNARRSCLAKHRWLPGFDTSRTCTRQVAWASTPYYKANRNRQPVFVPEERPPQLAHLAAVTQRQMQNYRNFLRRLNPIEEGQRYAECLATEGSGTKARVAEMLRVSRARVTQYMNLLDLPLAIQKFLLEHDDDPVIRKYFTERRLRPLMRVKNAEEILERFEEMMGQARRAAGVWGAEKRGRPARSLR